MKFRQGRPGGGDTHKQAKRRRERGRDPEAHTSAQQRTGPEGGTEESQALITRVRSSQETQEGRTRGAPSGGARGSLTVGIERGGTGHFFGIRLGDIGHIKLLEVGFARGAEGEEARPVDPTQPDAGEVAEVGVETFDRDIPADEVSQDGLVAEEGRAVETLEEAVAEDTAEVGCIADEALDVVMMGGTAYVCTVGVEAVGVSGRLGDGGGGGRQHAVTPLGGRVAA